MTYQIVNSKTDEIVKEVEIKTKCKERGFLAYWNIQGDSKRFKIVVKADTHKMED